MSVIVVVDLIAKDGELDALLEQLNSILPATRAYEGCLLLKMAVYEDQNKVGLFEEWQTKAHQEAYIAWRMENGHELIEPYIEDLSVTYADVKAAY